MEVKKKMVAESYHLSPELFLDLYPQPVYAVLNVKKEKKEMREFEKKTGFVDLKELTTEADEILGSEEENGGGGVVSFITGIISGFVSPTGVCSSKC